MSTLDLTILETLESDLGDRAAVCEVIRMYLQLLPERQRAIAGWATRTGDQVGLRRAAHTLASASAVVGAVDLRGLCRELELVRLPHQAAAFEELLSAWASCCAATQDALVTWLKAS